MTMKETPADREVRDRVNDTAAAELRAFVERVEVLEAEKRDLAQTMKEVYAEVKSRGYDAPAVRKLVALRRKDPQERQEADAILQLYMDQLGMD